MNGGSGITPTVELATTNGSGGFAYPYPVYPMMGGGFGGSGFGGFGGDGALWLIVLLALIWGNNGNGNGFFGGNNFDDGYAWLSNGQKEIMSNTNQGFDTLHLSNQLEGTRDGIYSLSNQLCNCCADMQQTVSNGFFNAEIAENNRQMANMNQIFDLSRQFADCCCENRLGLERLNGTVISENCADREALSNGIRDIISSQTALTQRILDQLCSDKIDAKNDKIRDLERQLTMADLKASQIAQTAQIRAGQIEEVDALYDRLNNCPVGTVPVYGRQPIFSCNNNGCGCNNGFYGNGTSF